jgi:hypothetical protein
MEGEKKINFVLIGLSILMIFVSVLNYLMNDDEVSLGIFVFAGLGFFFSGLKEKFEESRKKRFRRFSTTFYIIAALVFVYWLAVAKFHLL